MGRLDGKVVLITGTARGMGRASALLFAREGARVVGCDLDVDGAEETLSHVHAEGGEMSSTAPVDLGTSTRRVRGSTRLRSRRAGSTCSSTTPPPRASARSSRSTADDWHYTIRNELDLVYHVTAAAWPHLIARGGGSVINTASIAAIRGAAFFQQAAHGAAKGGVLAFTYHVAAAGAPHRIRANAILPGMIRTPSTEFLFETEESPGARLAAANPLGRVGEAEDVAKLASFLASDDAWYINAAAIPVDGGQAAIT